MKKHLGMILAGLVLWTATTLAQGHGLGSGTGMPPPPAAKSIPTMILNEAQVESFLGAMNDLRALSDEAGAWKVPESGVQSYAAGMKFSAAAKAILSKHGFANEEQFRQVAYNTALAYGVLKQGGKDKVRKELEGVATKQAAVMERIEQHLRPEQLKVLQRHAATGMAMANQMADVPDQNLDLVKKYSSQIDALSERKKN
jgi:hypothetical protein